MPIKIDEIKGGTLYLMNGDTYEPVMEVSKMNIICSDDLMDETPVTFDLNREATLTVEISNRNLKRARRLLLRGTNNWRKMHGFPLRRYK